jgi:hypothetical protein
MLADYNGTYGARGKRLVAVSLGVLCALTLNFLAFTR